ncbi:SIMPL domain-containing protein [Desulfotalea psychrophila]|uniref:Periplasmic protein n=1 Tax=Desulfotalea psychrophila (strain LSv54 / DSM 12343) TaxID=177439 RepID=Q6APX0_DESPS|nr:SIMPL domain-containing protein [Desulfotalea psychrophila]CAG35603.1 conserved hypothetical protein [Desulfotalea psychrophila LSv54]
MNTRPSPSFNFLGICLIIGLTSLGYLLANAAIEYKQFDRTVRVKGLSEREYQADTVIWPIEFSVTGNDLSKLYEAVEKNNKKIEDFLLQFAIKNEEISFSSPSIVDKYAQQYGGNKLPEFRYTAKQTVTVYSHNIKAVREIKSALGRLGKQGIVFTSANYQGQTEYIFNRLNEVKPEMIEEATKKAREVAEKFASDSESRLGKIKRASQGQFSIGARDRNNPHIKKIRVVSTVEYYLAD